MSKPTDKSLFIDTSVQRFYQQLLTGIANYETLGSRIIKQIKVAHAFRQVEQVRELAEILINIPIREYQLIAQYYLVWCKCRESGFQSEALERIAEQSQTYKSQALSSRAAFEVFTGEMEKALYFYMEALKIARTISDHLSARVAIAMVKSFEGFHASALKDMESAIPLMRYAEPGLFFNFHNSYAVELSEAGRLYEARNISRFVLASPFAHAYPEWQETGHALREYNQAFISVPQIEHRHVKVSQPATENKKKKPASVLSFPPLKEAPEPKKPDRLSPQEINELTTDEKRELVLAALRTGSYTHFDYDRFMVMVGLVDAGPTDKILDLEDEETINDIAVIWAHQIDPEELAGVFSALRDCDDRLRQKDIIDRIIRIAFEETLLCNTTEEAWRFRVERRLPEK
jgi:tetratricopeptide (TPR) repeat protein